ncbi:hypothetical protein DYY88_16195 [Leptolyngbya iicbica LK]|uniref:Uncharacterized protein n=3 Tax=Cyanophyceae TaxID=3028117 RepID=A0A4Q7E574_9CYAN|nr:hypothetical protein DYY88_16195 [Leptolyngbya sp. LK]
MLAPVKPWSRQLSALPIALYQQNSATVNRYGRWFLVAWLGAMADSKIFLAIATSTLTYQFLASGDRLPWETVEPLYQQCCTRLSRLGQTPLLASTLAFATTYGFAAAWSQLGGSWAAMTLLGLGAGNLLFFLKEVNAQSTVGSETAMPGSTAESFGPTWDELSAADPLKRLRAVRSLLHWCLSSDAGTKTYLPGTDVTVRSHLVDCFRVMLTHESEPIVRAALVEGLKALQPKPQLPAGQPAIAPLKSKPQTVQTPVRQRSVEYVEP